MVCRKSNRPVDQLRRHLDGTIASDLLLELPQIGIWGHVCMSCMSEIDDTTCMASSDDFTCKRADEPCGTSG